MRYSVLAADPRGITFFQDEQLPWEPYPIDANLPVFATPLLDARQVGFLRLPKDYYQDWHTAPSMRFVMVLSGLMEVEAGTGERREFAAGSVLLVTDIEGQGHRTRVLGAQDVVFAWVPTP